MSRFRWPLRLAGAGLLAAAAAVHLDLYLTGYRTIHVIGPLFLLQVIAGFAVALAVLLTPLAARSSQLPAAAAAAAAACFAVATLGGYLLSLWVGLFGFREVRTTAGIVAGLLEIAAFAVLALLAVGSAAPAVAVVAAISIAAFAVFGVSVATASGGAPAGAGSAGAHAVLRTDSVNGVTVLTDSKGMTVYWFALDTPASSACYGTCAAYWPPVYGTPAVAAGVTGVTGALGTIRRANGAIQATYDGHPLYTYIGDTAPGQAGGNNLNLNGGYWHEIPVSG